MFTTAVLITESNYPSANNQTYNCLHMIIQEVNVLCCTIWGVLQQENALVVWIIGVGPV